MKSKMKQNRCYMNLYPMLPDFINDWVKPLNSKIGLSRFYCVHHSLKNGFVIIDEIF